MKFTPTEAEVLGHRLEVPDAIADAVNAEYETTCEACRVLSERLRAGEDFQPTSFELTILKDAADGSTYFAGVLDEVALGHVSRGKVLAWMRAANSLERKLGVRIPRD